MAATKQPWAVLLCKFADVPAEPPAGGLGIPFSTTYPLLFTSVGVFTQNVINYFWAMSHRNVDMSDSQVFGWYELDTKAADLVMPSPAPPGWVAITTRDAVIAKAKAAARAANVPLDSYHGVIVVMNLASGISQGGTGSSGCNPQPWVFADFRFVNDNGTDTFGHEMGHAYGLQHSRADSPDPNYNPVNCGNRPPDPDYRDPWDVMSAGCTYMAKDPNFAVAGPGLNASNMRFLKWLDESRVWHSPTTGFIDVVTLRPLHDLASPGWLAAELPMAADATGQSKYIIEYRQKSSWDGGIPRSCVMIHRQVGPNSYSKFSTQGNPDMQPGEVFVDQATSGSTLQRLSRAKVLSIDDSSSVATIELAYTTTPQLPTVEISYRPADLQCQTQPACGSTMNFALQVTYIVGSAAFQPTWSVIGGTPTLGESLNLSTFSAVAPATPGPVTVSVQVMFDDGTLASSTRTINCISLVDADLQLFACRTAHQRFRPIPWWEWEPNRLVDPARTFPPQAISAMHEQLTRMARTLGEVLRLL